MNMSQAVVDESVFAKSLAEHGATAVISPDNRAIDAIRFAGDGAMAWRCPCGADDIERHQGAILVRKVAEIKGAIASVLADASRSESWKEREIERITVTGETAFEAAKAAADRTVATSVAAIARECAPPPIPANDYAAALIDFECRQQVRTMDRDAVAAFGAALLRGENARALSALARSPMPWPPMLERIVADAWDQRDPAAAEARQRIQDRVDWLRMVIRQASNALPRRARTSAEKHRDETDAARTAADAARNAAESAIFARNAADATMVARTTA